MSESPQRTGAAAGKPTAEQPRAVVHKRILDVAADEPDAPVAALADEVSGASPDLVERVLEEYGDPADGSGSGPDEANGTDQSADTDAGENGTDPGTSPEPDTGTADPVGTADPAGTEDPTGHGESEDPSESGREALTLLSDGAAPSTGSENGAGPDRDADAAAADDRDPATDAADAESPGTDGHGVGDAESDGDDRDAESGSGEGRLPAAGDLDEKQLAVLRAVCERPTATQKELAASLGVSRATVSKRVNRIEGFDWQDRAAFVDRLFRDGDPVDGSTAAETASGRVAGPAGPGRTRRDLEAAVDELADRVAALNERVDDVTASASGDAGALVDDPELAHKVVHACFESDRISREEELRLLRTLLDE